MWGRRAKLIALASCAVVAATAAVAWAAPATITGTGLNTFDATSYNHDAGTVATLNVTGSNHNVTANATGPDGKALFRSATITPGSTPVNGTQFVGPGTYGFICSVHPTTMQANLVVSGTPLPRPAVTLKVLSKNLDKVAGKGKLPVRVTGSGSSGVVDLTAKLGNKTLGSRDDVSVAPGQALKTILKLTKSGRSRLRNKDQATVKVTGAVDFGFPSTAKRKLS